MFLQQSFSPPTALLTKGVEVDIFKISNLNLYHRLQKHTSNEIHPYTTIFLTPPLANPIATSLVVRSGSLKGQDGIHDQ